MKTTRHLILRLVPMTLLVAAILMPQSVLALGTQPSGGGTTSNPYQIATPANLLWFADQVNTGNNNICAKLTADIDLTGSNTEDYMIGTKEKGFKGEFDGQGHTVKGIYVNSTKTGKNGYLYAGGLFGCIDVTTNTPAVVKNVTVQGRISLYGLTKTYYVGGVIAIAWGDVNVSNVVSKVNIEIVSDGKYAHCGGVVGSVEWFEDGNYDGELTVSNCVNYGTINVACGEICGGVVGYIRNGSISDCLNVGDVNNREDGYTAGVLGYVNSTGCTMTRCLNVGSITNFASSANAYSVYYAKSGRIGTVSQLYYKSGTATSTSSNTTSIAWASLKNGSLGYTFASNGWGQIIGSNSVSNDYPIPNNAAYRVYQASGNYYNNITSTIPTGDFTTTIETTAQYITNRTRIGDTKSFNVTANAGKYITTVKHNGTTLTPTSTSGNVKTYAYTVVPNNAFTIATAGITCTTTLNRSDFGTAIDLTNNTVGSTETFTATPKAGYYIKNASINGSTIAGTSTGSNGTKSFSFTVKESNTVVINTAAITCSTTLNQSTIGTAISLTDNTVGSTETFTVTPKTGYCITGATINGSTIAGTSTGSNGTKSFSFTVEGSNTVVINTAAIPCTTTLKQSVFGTAINLTNNTIGSTETFSVTPKAGYYIKNASINESTIAGTSTGSDGTKSYSFTVQESNTVIINTTPITCNIRFTWGTTTVDITDNTIGSTETFTVTPPAGYYITGAAVINDSVVSGTAVPGSTTGTMSYSFTVKESNTLSMNLATIKCTATLNQSTSTLNLNDNNVGSTETFTATPKAGYYITGATINGEAVSGSDTEGLTNGTKTFSFPVQESNTVVINTNTIAYEMPATGDFTTTLPDNLTDKRIGDTVEFTVTPPEGKDIAKVTHNDISLTPSAAEDDGTVHYTFTVGVQNALSVVIKPAMVDDFYEIVDAGQLYWFAEQVNGGQFGLNAKLMADIVVNENVLDADGRLNGSGAGMKAWTPIGLDEDGKRYDGVFDGQGYTISGLYVDDRNKSCVGLFGSTGTNSVIKNVGVTEGYFYAFLDVSGICGSNRGIVENCFNAATCRSVSNTSGGIVSTNFATITQCYNKGWINGLGGGVCHENRGTITYCYNEGRTEGGGGLCVNNYGSILYCYNKGYINYLGGGVCDSNMGTITHCYNEGTVYVAGNGGGVCNYNGGTITHCYNTGVISSYGGLSGGMCGGICVDNASNATITQAYYLEGTANDGVGSSPSLLSETTRMTAAQFASGEVAWLLNDSTEYGDLVWYQTLGEGGDAYPVMDNTHGKVVYDEATRSYHNHTYTDGICSVCDRCEAATLNGDYYEIATSGHLYWFAQQVNEGQTDLNAKLTADIVVNREVLNADGSLNLNEDSISVRTWTPIGGNEDGKRYNGIFDGQGHTIGGLYLNDSEREGYVGLFGATGTTGVIKQVGVEDSYFHANEYVSGVCGSNDGKVENCFTAATCVSESNMSGGMVSRNAGTIENGFNIGLIIGEGGGVCYHNSGTITNTYYLDSIAVSGVGGNHSGSAVTIAMAADQFVGGEVAWWLNGGNYEGDVTWYQSIGEDVYPVLDSTHGKVAYEEAEQRYHSYINGICTGCDAYEPATLNGDYYEIANAGQLYWFAEQVNGGQNALNAKLTADIVVNRNVLNEDGGINGSSSDYRTWTPIAQKNKYQGFFDGRGYTISGLFYSGSDQYIGLFGTIDSNGTVQKVGVVDNFFSGYSRVGGVCGYNYGTIANCYTAGCSYAGKSAAIFGGVCGQNIGTIINCHNKGTLSGAATGSYVGGITGDNSGIITNCYNTANVSSRGRSSRVGGISGDNSGIMTNCYNTASITASGYLSWDGSLCGEDNENSPMTNCYYLEGAGGDGDTDGNATMKTAAQFASGEVAWLLNGSEAGESPAWRQTIGEDDFPVLDEAKGIVLKATPDGLNSIVRPTAGSLAGVTAVYNFAGIYEANIYGVEYHKALAAHHPYLFTTDSRYVNFVPSDADVIDNTETCGLTGVLEAAGQMVYGPGNTAGEGFSIVFTASAMKYANPKGNRVKYGKCYVKASEAFVSSVPLMASPLPAALEGVTTGIDALEIPEADGKCYNLMGIEVGEDYRGIVIQNGKKMLRK